MVGSKKEAAVKRTFRAQAHAVTRHTMSKRLVALIALVLGLGVVISQPPLAPAQPADVAPAQQTEEDHSTTEPEPTTTEPASTQPTTTTDPNPPP